jgi:hypothetical protein
VQKRRLLRWPKIKHILAFHVARFLHKIRLEKLAPARSYQLRSLPIPPGLHHQSEATVPFAGPNSAKVCNVHVCHDRRDRYFLSDSLIVAPQASEVFVGRIGRSDGYGNVLRQSGTTIWAKVQASRDSLDRAISIPTWAPHNWFHWIINDLSALVELPPRESEWAGAPILIPPGQLLPPQFRLVLEMLAPDFSVKALSETRFLQVKRMLVLGSGAPMVPAVPHLKGAPIQNLIRPGSLLRYKEMLAERFGNQTTKVRPIGERVFLARDSMFRRSDDQPALQEVAERHGFVVHFANRYSMAENSVMLSKAKEVIGSHGANWAEFIHCARGGRGLLFRNTGSVLPGNWFQQLATGLEASIEEAEVQGQASFQPRIEAWLNQVKTRHRAEGNPSYP